MILHEDVLMFMMCFLFATTYYNIDKKYHIYYKGIGNFKEICFSKFQKTLLSAQVFFSSMNDFIQSQKLDPHIEKILKKLIYWIELDCFCLWEVLCPPEQHKEGFLLILDTVSIGIITEKYMMQYQIIQDQKEKLQSYISLPTNPTLKHHLRSIYFNLSQRIYQVFQSLKQNGFRETYQKIMQHIHS